LISESNCWTECLSKPSFHWFHITAGSDVAFHGGSETLVSRRAWDSVGATCLLIGAGHRSLETGTGRGRETGSQPASATVGHPRELWRFGLLGHAASIGRELCRFNPAERPAAAACPYRKPKTAVDHRRIGRSSSAMGDLLKLIWYAVAGLFRSRAALQNRSSRPSASAQCAEA
jgi:hypothetical protein